MSTMSETIQFKCPALKKSSLSAGVEREEGEMSEVLSVQ